MPAEAHYPTDSDIEQLRVLSVLYFIYGGLAGCMCVAGLVLVAGSLIAGSVGAASMASSDQGLWPWNILAPAFGATLVATFGAAFAVLGGAMAAVRIATGFALRQHRHRTFCLVVAVLTALSLPLGSVLGLATLLVMLRPGVGNLF